MKGTISNIVKDKGFGFIRFENKEYFFHRSSCYDFDLIANSYTSPRKVIEVTFDEGNSPKGPRAENVRLVDMNLDLD